MSNKLYMHFNNCQNVHLSLHTCSNTQTVLSSSGRSGTGLNACKLGQCGDTTYIDTTQHPVMNIFTHTYTRKIT